MKRKLKVEKLFLKVAVTVKYAPFGRTTRNKAVHAAKSKLNAGLSSFGHSGIDVFEYKIGNAVELLPHVPRHAIVQVLEDIADAQSIADQHTSNVPNSYQSGKVAGLIEARNIIARLLEKP